MARYEAKELSKTEAAVEAMSPEELAQAKREVADAQTEEMRILSLCIERVDLMRRIKQLPSSQEDIEQAVKLCGKEKISYGDALARIKLESVEAYRAHLPLGGILTGGRSATR
jgi:uncharacterized membrane protein YqiK